jgi:hypothetical protein
VIGEPRDRGAYGIAIASLGLALAIVLIGICWIATEQESASETVIHRCTQVGDLDRCVTTRGTDPPASAIPRELWIVLAMLGGLFTGILLPYPRLEPKWLNVALLAVPAAFIAGIITDLPSAHHSVFGYGALSILLGFLIPSPAWND